MKCKAFTIAELVIGMLLTSLVAGLAYHCYFLFQRQFMQLHQNTSSTNELLMLRKAMQADIDRADAVYDSTGSLVMQPQNVSYTFNNDHIVRVHETVIDSFKVNVNNIRLEPVGEASGKIHHVTLQLQSRTLFFVKHYSAAQLMHE